MNNNLDKQYLLLLAEIQNMGYYKGDRTGTGTLSLFGREIRHQMSDGFPLITSKKMYTKGVIVELIWFLNGGTNIKFLVENGCNIWNGDAYKKYVTATAKNTSEYNAWMRDNGDGTLSMFTMKEFVEKIKTDNLFAEMWGELGPIYGAQWRQWHVSSNINEETGEVFIGNLFIDQIANLIHDLKNNPDSRRLMVNAWNVGEISKMTLPPCHYGFECWTRELSLKERFDLLEDKTMKQEFYRLSFNSQPTRTDDEERHSLLNDLNVPEREISLRWIQRSCDFPLGIPFNIASYGFLLTMLAQQCNMVPGELIGSFGDCHIYQNQLEGVTQQLSNEIFNLPILKLNKAKSIYDYKLEDFQILNYENAGEVKYPLSN